MSGDVCKDVTSLCLIVTFLQFYGQQYIGKKDWQGLLAMKIAVEVWSNIIALELPSPHIPSLLERVKHQLFFLQTLDPLLAQIQFMCGDGTVWEYQTPHFQ